MNVQYVKGICTESIEAAVVDEDSEQYLAIEFRSTANFWHKLQVALDFYDYAANDAIV